MEANEICEGPIFKLPTRFAGALSLIATAYILSAGMPILLLLISLCLCSRYYIDKWTVTQY